MTNKNDVNVLDPQNISINKNNFRAQTLHNISHDISDSFDLDVIHKITLYAAVGTLGAFGGVFLVYDSEFDRFEIANKLNRKISRKKFRVSDYFKENVSKVFSDGIVISDGISNISKPLKAFMDLIKCCALVPIWIKGEFYGALAVSKKISNQSYSPPELNFLSAICSLVSISIENAKSQSELNYRIFELSTLYEISKEFSSTLEIDQIQTSIIFCCMGVVGAKRGAIFLFDKESSSICLNHAVNFPPFVNRDLKVAINPKLLRGLSKIHEPFFLSSLKENSKEHALFKRIVNELSVVDNPLFIPQIIKNDMVGYLVLAEKINKNVYSRLDINLLSALSYQSAIAITNSKSYQEVKNLAKRNAALYEELKIATEEKLKSERLATLGMVVSTITHDIKNPLTSIRYFSALLGEEDNIEPEDKKKYVDIIESEIERLVGMIEELLSFAKGGGPLKIKQHCIKGIIEEVFIVLERDFYDKDITVTQDIKFSGMVSIDDEKLKRVIYNLAYNARDAMSDSGGEIRIQVFREKTNFIVTIADNGAGIPEKIIDTLFMPFVTQGKTKGTGLGLAISKKIIDDHNGELTFTTKKNNGTTFFIKIPIHHEPA